ncbi:MAG: hypothetical protein IMZ52_01165 [Actinobacteria bacterium]|nr:hypothetical protein [Actinomycetota bacterium]MBE3114748.1 hypothetical protein [Actinomycetota bacterium]
MSDIKENWKLKDKDVIMLLLPTEDGKYIIAKAIIKDEPIETLKDAIIELPEAEGKGRLKYPVVLVRDIDKLKEKVVNDIKELKPITDCDDNQDYMDGYFMGYEMAQMDTEFIIKKRLGYE